MNSPFHTRPLVHSGPARHVAWWLIGGLVGTCLIAVTSPWFVRSYLPLRVDPVRETWTLPPGADYRWRSEGYATTQIGPLGMPGKTSLSSGSAAAPQRRTIRVALWGDSQAEGVAVADSEKLFAQAEQLAAVADLPMAVYPLARSGEDAAVWLTQMPAVERELEIDVHVMLIVDLPDLLTAHEAPLAPVQDSGGGGMRAALAAHLPDFVLQAARHVLTEADGSTPRTLRFSLGPVATDPPQLPPAEPDHDWPKRMESIAAIAERPVIILHAPPVPQIIGGRVQTEGPWADSVAEMQRAAEAQGITVVSARAALLESAAEGRWPHGFHNGRIGSGHLNATGYRIVARRLVQAVERTIGGAVGQAASASSAQPGRPAARPTLVWRRGTRD